MSLLEEFARLAEVEFADIVVQAGSIGTKLRILLCDSSYIDVWVSEKLAGRFGFHWERRHLDGSMFRYDNFPDTNWQGLSTFPYHFHDGTYEHVLEGPFSLGCREALREFLEFARQRLCS